MMLYYKLSSGTNKYMAEKNIVVDRADMLMARHGISQAEINNPQEDGSVATREIDGVGTVKYYVAAKSVARMPNQMGDRD